VLIEDSLDFFGLNHGTGDWVAIRITTSNRLRLCQRKAISYRSYSIQFILAK